MALAEAQQAVYRFATLRDYLLRRWPHFSDSAGDVRVIVHRGSSPAFERSSKRPWKGSKI